jgi:hypothetical protein
LNTESNVVVNLFVQGRKQADGRCSIEDESSFVVPVTDEIVTHMARTT